MEENKYRVQRGSLLKVCSGPNAERRGKKEKEGTGGREDLTWGVRACDGEKRGRIIRPVLIRKRGMVVALRSASERRQINLKKVNKGNFIPWGGKGRGGKPKGGMMGKRGVQVVSRRWGMRNRSSEGVDVRGLG